MASFRREFIDWREALGLSREMAAILLGVSVRTIQGWETKREPTSRIPQLRRAMRDIERDKAARKLLTLA